MTTTNLEVDTVPTNTTNPSVPVNDAMEVFDACLAGTVTRNITTDANYTLISADYLTSVLVVTDTGPVLTTGRDIIFPAHFPSILVTNSTAETLTLKKSGQTGVSLSAGETVRVSSGVTDVVQDTAPSGGGGGSETVTIVTEASTSTMDPATHAGRSRYLRCAGDVTFDNAEGYSAGEVYNIRATAAIDLIETGVTLTPPNGGTLALDADMAVTVIMTSSSAGDVIGQTVPA